MKKLLPGKFSETIGVQHTKICVFDNDVCISGANLSNDYFSQRQDRYILIKDVPKLANYFEELVESISSFSFDLNQGPDENKGEPRFMPYGFSNDKHPYKGNYKKFIENAHNRIHLFLSEQKKINSLKFDKEGEAFIKAGEIKTESMLNSLDSESDTWIFPSVQMGLLRIHQDELLTLKFLENTGADTGSRIVFGTGYFNLTDEYMNTIMHKSKAKFDIICAHPEANSFFNAPFPLNGVPFAYSFIANHFMNLCKQIGASNRIEMFEYQRSGWTFHGKGRY